MKFSIVIPTRERADTLGYSIKSVLSQPYRDVQLVIMDNASADNTQLVIQEYLADERVDYIHSDCRLPMTGNWERALSHARGEYIFILGDDDALMPDALEICSAILAQHATQIISWPRYFYGWPNAISLRARDRLFLHLASNCLEVEGRHMLREFYASRLSFECLPMIYNSFVSRALIDEIRGDGPYFRLPAPDLCSGIANAYHCDRYIFINRALSISGSSASSNGASSMGVDRQPEAFNLFISETPWVLQPELQAAGDQRSMLAIPEFANGDLMLKAKRTYFLDDASIQVDLRALFNVAAQALHRYGKSYRAKRDYLVALSGLDLPTECAEFVEVPATQGLTEAKDLLVLNCAQAGVHNVADAAKLAQAVLPRVL